MDLSKLEELKLKLTTAKDFQTVFEFFLDHFGDHEEFIKLGGPVEDTVLFGSIAGVARQLYGPDTVVLNPVMIAVPGTPFIHGRCVIGGRMANVLYFTDIQVGLVGVFSLNPKVPARYTRFSNRMLPPGAVPSSN
jgi:hypothetical protein